MKREINVLSPQAKARRENAIYLRRERSIVVALSISLVVILASYGAIWWVFFSLHQDLSDQIVMQTQDQSEILKEIRALNREVGVLDSRIASYTLWTERIEDVLAAVPSGILVSKLELSENPAALIVTGSASQGSEVVAYQSALEALPWVDRVVAPLQNFARFPTATVVFTIFQKTANENTSETNIPDL